MALEKTKIKQKTIKRMKEEIRSKQNIRRGRRQVGRSLLTGISWPQGRPYTEQRRRTEGWQRAAPTKKNLRKGRKK